MPDHTATVTSAGGWLTFATVTKTVLRDVGTLRVPIGDSMLVPMAVSPLRGVVRVVTNTTQGVLDGLGSGSQTRTLLKWADFALGSDIESETGHRGASGPTDAIPQEAQNHDFTSIGSSGRKFRLRNLVFKPVQETLAGREDITGLTIRDADRTTRSLSYRHK